MSIERLKTKAALVERLVDLNEKSLSKKCIEDNEVKDALITCYNMLNYEIAALTLLDAGNLPDLRRFVSNIVFIALSKLSDPVAKQNVVNAGKRIQEIIDMEIKRKEEPFYAD